MKSFCILTISSVMMFSSSRALSIDNPFGICHPWNGLGELGIGWCRSGAGATAFDWGRMAPDRDTLTFKHAEGEYDNWMKPFGIKQVGLLGYTPRWASSAPEGAQNPGTYPPSDLFDWSDYIERTTKHFAGRIPYYEVWNEQDIGFWKGTCNEYCELLKSAYLAVKRGDLSAKVVYGGLAGVNLPFLKECYEHGVAGYFDAMAVHPYQWGDTFNDEWFCRQIRDLRELMLDNGDDKEIFLTEFGWESKGTPESEDIQARLLMQAILTSLVLREEARVEIVFPFTVRDWGSPSYGFIRDDDTRKPSWTAYSVLIEKMLGRRCRYRIPIKKPLRGYLFSPGRQSDPTEFVLALFSTDKDIHPLEFDVDSDEVSVTSMLGESQILKSWEGKLSLSVGPQPVYIQGFGAQAIRPAEPIQAFDPRSEAACDLPDVWISLDIPNTSRRIFLRRGVKETVCVKVSNDSEETQSVQVSLSLSNGALVKPRVMRKAITIEPKTLARLHVPIRIPSSAALEVSDLTVTASVGSRSIPLLNERVRITDGYAVEFLANSQIEEEYIVDFGGSCGAPSVRFGGEGWTYLLNLTRATSASVSMDIGAHEGGYWCVKASLNNRDWDTILEGHSSRDWHEFDLTQYAGAPVFLKITGDDLYQQQLGEFVLTAVAE